jgi:hypothetical protein
MAHGSRGAGGGASELWCPVPPSYMKPWLRFISPPGSLAPAARAFNEQSGLAALLPGARPGLRTRECGCCFEAILVQRTRSQRRFIAWSFARRRVSDRCSAQRGTPGHARESATALRRDASSESKKWCTSNLMSDRTESRCALEASHLPRWLVRREIMTGLQVEPKFRSRVEGL